MAVKETGSKPAGTGPPAELPPVARDALVDLVVVGPRVVEVLAVVVVVAGTVVTVVVVLPLWFAADGPLLPQAAAVAATASITTVGPSTPLVFTDLVTLGHTGRFRWHLPLPTDTTAAIAGRNGARVSDIKA